MVSHFYSLVLPCLLAAFVTPIATSPHYPMVHIVCEGEAVLQAKVHIYHKEKELALLFTKHGSFHTDFLKDYNIEDLEIMIRHDCNMEEEWRKCNLPYYEQRMYFDVFFKKTSHRQVIELADEDYIDYKVPMCL